MELSATAYVVLGMLRHEPRTGYEIKAAVDKSTRFFWAASYGQIYPELRRLEAAGLIEGRAEPRGGRRRTVYELTDAGREELRQLARQRRRGARDARRGTAEALLRRGRARRRRSRSWTPSGGCTSSKLAALEGGRAGARAAAAEGDPYPDWSAATGSRRANG